MSTTGEVESSVVEHLVRSFVEQGIVNVAGKSSEEITSEALRIWREDYSGRNVKFLFSNDHGDRILANAEYSCSNGDFGIACAMFATQIEHRLNSLLKLIGRRKDFDDSTIRVLLRETGVRVKLIIVYMELSGHEPPKQMLSDLTRVSDARNRFLHYKFPNYSFDEENVFSEEGEFESCIEPARTFLKTLDEFERTTIYGNFQISNIQQAEQADAGNQRSAGA